VVSAAAALAVQAGPSAFAAAEPPEATIRAAGGPTAVEGSYLVVLKGSGAGAATTRAAGAVAADARTLTGEHGGTVRRTYAAALRGFEARLTEGEARSMAGDPAVAFVEQNHRITAFDTQENPPSYGLDRIDQSGLPLDQRYTFPNRADDVTIFVVDSGIRFSHDDFGGRAVSGFDAVDGGSADDCNGHGTHVAGTAGGADHGVAKNVKLVAVRALDCAGDGTTDGVVAAIDFVTRTASGPAVANLSLGGGASEVVDAAVERSIAAGISYVVAAGNDNADACDSSPARVPAAITVAATDREDSRAVDFSNWGGCVDLFAPGAGITSAAIGSDTEVETRNGTSMAAPHVAGAAALFLQTNPGASPDEVTRKLLETAVKDVVEEGGTGSPNVLLQVPR
jgi:subtilisin family serine protease